MTFLDLAEGTLRVFGVLYAGGALFMLNAMRTELFLDRAIAQIEQMIADFEGAAPPVADDRGRAWWLVAGAALTLAAGVTMALGLRVSVIALGAVAVHQMLYFLRQRHRERAAATAEAAENARPTQATRNGFVSGLLMLVLAAALERMGALS